MEKDLKGTVKWFDLLKGYGFIKHNDSDGEYFAYKTDVVDKDIKQGDLVKFDEKEGRKGIVATFVRKIKYV